MNKLLAIAVVVALAACSKSNDPAASAPQGSPAETPAAAAPAKVDLPAGAYTLDRAHSSLIFRVNHLGFSNYTGRFERFDAQLQFDPNDPATASVTVDVDPKSLDVESPRWVSSTS
jgi:polyisoprenoid-binding protein YceI